MKQASHLLKYDSTLGKFDAKIEYALLQHNHTACHRPASAHSLSLQQLFPALSRPRASAIHADHSCLAAAFLLIFAICTLQDAAVIASPHSKGCRLH